MTTTTMMTSETLGPIDRSIYRSIYICFFGTTTHTDEEEERIFLDMKHKMRANGKVAMTNIVPKVHREGGNFSTVSNSTIPTGGNKQRDWEGNKNDSYYHARGRDEESYRYFQATENKTKSL